MVFHLETHAPPPNFVGEIGIELGLGWGEMRKAEWTRLEILLEARCGMYITRRFVMKRLNYNRLVKSNAFFYPISPPGPPRQGPTFSQLGGGVGRDRTHTQSRFVPAEYLSRPPKHVKRSFCVYALFALFFARIRRVMIS